MVRLYGEPKRNSRNSSAAFRDTAYKGYLIRQSPINGEMWIEKEGFIIGRVPKKEVDGGKAVEYAKGVIDKLT